MELSTVLEALERDGVVPVAVIDEGVAVEQLADAVFTAGARCIEITMRTPAAVSTIRQLADRGDLIVGAGTVLNTRQLDQAVQAGAKFVVTPGWSREVAKQCVAQGIPLIPGVATPTEVMEALAFGLDTLKLFPANLLGGPAAITSFSGPFPDVNWMPTGGVTPTNLGAYLKIPTVLAVGGSWMVSRQLLRSDAWDMVRKLMGEALAMARAA